jgi:ribonuclease HI
MDNLCKTYIIYTDGSSATKNGRRCGGIGVYIEDINYETSKTYVNNNPTNQRMELQACLTGIKSYLDIVKNKTSNETSDKTCDRTLSKLIIRTDSMYSINCITKWCDTWKTNNWRRKVGNKYKEILHFDLIKEIYDLCQEYDIKFEHVRAHQKQPNKESQLWSKWYGNNKADNLALAAMEMGFVNHKDERIKF